METSFSKVFFHSPNWHSLIRSARAFVPSFTNVVSLVRLDPFANIPSHSYVRASLPYSQRQRVTPLFVEREGHSLIRRGRGLFLYSHRASLAQPPSVTRPVSNLSSFHWLSWFSVNVSAFGHCCGVSKLQASAIERVDIDGDPEELEGEIQQQEDEEEYDEEEKEEKDDEEDSDDDDYDYDNNDSNNDDNNDDKDEDDNIIRK
ncbi:uncharacterized protein HKW66_Vig0204730 [Vigna angularis]|uniref:Uncharacterized protein n=1 Tax=Phaseolus angularis TaxID=3914 RepID=A0A8T0JSY5_PHAAN|nr:uncharacterized protein LOC108346786 [Vigna angularis]KAG2381100.1 uncharacterized protein HKW66_Vig0204730 [Vigna angularis]